MNATPQLGWWISGSVVAAAVALWGWQGQALAAERAALRQSRDSAAEFARLQAENRTLKEKEATGEELAKLRAELSELERIRAEVAELKANALAPDLTAASPTAAPPIVPAAAWKNAGNRTPAAAVETALWAAAGGDVDALAAIIGFRPRTKAALERAFAALPENARRPYGSPERMVAFFTVKDVPAGDMQVLQERQVGEDEMEITVRLRPEDRRSASEVALTLKRFDGEWRLMVPPAAVQKQLDVIGGALGGPRQKGVGAAGSAGGPP